jgi:hypothetical protein
LRFQEGIEKIFALSEVECQQHETMYLSGVSGQFCRLKSGRGLTKYSVVDFGKEVGCEHSIRGESFTDGED